SLLINNVTSPPLGVMAATWPMASIMPVNMENLVISHRRSVAGGAITDAGDRAASDAPTVRNNEVFHVYRHY
ncbi:MAG: hypothetical protein VX595_01305, partial [Pseudomonadota bacterium]|nr:hypothetical protein [Pseudomonadota bacterium]